MNKNYVKAQEKNYSNQGKIYTIPTNKLGKIVTIPLGFQPLGIASLGNKIAIAAYFEPAICLAEISYDKAGMHFAVDWIRGVKHGNKSVRLFPDFFKPGEVNRAQTVNFDGNDLWVSRNGDRTFFKICKPAAGDGWVLSSQKKILPGRGMVHSALLLPNESILETIESTALKAWRHCQYDWPSLDHITTTEREPFTYGIAFRDDDDNNSWVITDYRSSAQRKGICYGNRLVIPDVYGDGLCFLPNGSILATRYGQASDGPFSGEPGALIYIPAALVPK